MSVLFPTHADHLRFLPVPCRKKLQQLQNLAEDAQMLTRAVLERENTLRHEISVVQAHLDSLPPNGRAEIQKQYDALLEDLKEMDAARLARDVQRRNFSQTLATIRETFLPRLFGGTDAYTDLQHQGQLVAFAIDSRPRKGESLKDAIVRVRREVAKTQGELTHVRTAPRTRAEIQQEIREYVAALGRQGMPRLNFVNGDTKIELPDSPQFSNPGTVVAAPAGSASALEAALHPQQMIEALEQQIPTSLQGISASERTARTRDLTVQLEVLEFHEEALVEQAIVSGLECHRRLDASPWAILGMSTTDAWVASVQQQAAE